MYDLSDHMNMIGEETRARLAGQAKDIEERVRSWERGRVSSEDELSRFSPKRLLRSLKRSRQNRDGRRASRYKLAPLTRWGQEGGRRRRRKTSRKRRSSRRKGGGPRRHLRGGMDSAAEIPFYHDAATARSILPYMGVNFSKLSESDKKEFENIMVGVGLGNRRTRNGPVYLGVSQLGALMGAEGYKEFPQVKNYIDKHK